MVSKELLASKMKEKILLVGKTGTGKTYTAIRVAEFCALKGRQVVVIDPEYGSLRELELLSDEALKNIELRVCPTWPEFEKAVKKEDSEFFLKIVDGLSEAFVLSQRYLTDRFISLGEYRVMDKVFQVKDTDTFTLPYVSYPKVYDNVRSVVWELMEQRPHIIATLHPMTGTSPKERLVEDIYRKFDTVLRLETSVNPDNTVCWQSFVIKHRGKGMTGVVLKEHVNALIKLFERRIA